MYQENASVARYRIDKCSGTSECKEYTTSERFEEAVEEADDHLELYLNMVAFGDRDPRIGLAILLLGHKPVESVKYDPAEPDGLVYDTWVPMKAPFDDMPSPRMRVYKTS